MQQLGPFAIFVSAGAQGSVGPIPFEKMSAADIESTISSRLLARIFPVHAAIPVLRARGGGTILMITTDAARHVTSGESMIGATGASIILLTKALARELARHKIRVNSIALTIEPRTHHLGTGFSVMKVLKIACSPKRSKNFLWDERQMQTR